MKQISPSKQKMQLARQFASELQKTVGTNLKAVFVYGSVAADLAKPKSDIDVFVICRDYERARYAIEQMLAKQRPKRKSIGRISPLILETRYFEDVNYMRQSGLIGQIFRDGAIPILGMEYAKQHSSMWNFPNRATIQERYGRQRERLAFKRRESQRIIKQAFRGK